MISQRRSASPSAIRRSGSVLIVSLWALALLAVFAVILGEGLRQRASLVARLDDRSRLRAIAEAGVVCATVQLASEEVKSYDAIQDWWSINDGAYRGIRLDAGRCDVCYNYIDEITGVPGLRYGIVDEERKINVNTADRPVLERLFRSVAGLDEMAAQELAAAVIDWADADNELSTPGSAEDRYYSNLPLPYLVKNAPVDILDELLLVKGMDARTYALISDFITAYGSGKVNVNTAPMPVLIAIGFTEDIAKKIIEFRAGKDGIIATADDNVFPDAGSIVIRLAQAYNISDNQIAVLTGIVERYAGTSSSFFTVRCVASLDGHRETAETIAVIDRKGIVYSWRETV